MALYRTGELKKRAALAKQRLKMGYWDRRHGTAEPDTANASVYDTVRAPEPVEVPAHDDKLYKKVCAILDRDEATTNPIGQLIDSDEYSRLDAAARQRYVLELSNKFRELKDRYYRERTGS